MDMKKFLLASLAGGITLFVLGALIYGVALPSFMEDNTLPGIMRVEPIMWSMVLSQLAMGGFVAYVYLRWASISTFVGGAKGGAIIGAFIGIGIGFDLYAISNMMSLTFAVVDVALWAIRFGIAGGVIGHVIGMGKGD